MQSRDSSNAVFESAHGPGRPSVPRRSSSARIGGATARLVPPPFALDVLRVSLFLFIIISISTVQGYVRPLGMLRPGLTLWGLALGAVFLVPKGVRWPNVFASFPPKAVLFLVALACLSAPFGLSIGASGNFLLTVYFRIAVLFFILVIAIRSVTDVRLFIWAFVSASGILAFLALTVMEVASGHGGTRVAASSMYDANDLGMIFLTSIPLALLLFEMSGTKARLLLLVFLGLISGAIAITGSRGAFVGFVFVLPLLFVAMGHISAKRRLGFGIALVLGLIVGAPEGYWERIGTIVNVQDDYNVRDQYGRVEVSKRGVQYMLAYPFGVGVDNFPRAEFTISPIAREAAPGAPLRMIAPHNTYVQVGAEMGLLALLTWVGLIGAGTVGVLRIRRRAQRLAHRPGASYDELFIARCTSYVPVSFIGFAVTSYFVSHAYTPVFYVIVAILSGILVQHRRHVRALRRTATSGSRERASVAPLVPPPLVASGAAPRVV